MKHSIGRASKTGDYHENDTKYMSLKYHSNKKALVLQNGAKTSMQNLLGYNITPVCFVCFLFAFLKSPLPCPTSFSHLKRIFLHLSWLANKILIDFSQCVIVIVASSSFFSSLRLPVDTITQSNLLQPLETLIVSNNFLAWSFQFG